MKRIFVLFSLLIGFLSVSAQTTPVNIVRSNDSFTQVDNYLVAAKRLGIPTGPTPTLNASTTSQNSAKLFYNTTDDALYVYDVVSTTWQKVTADVDLSAYWTIAQVDSAITSQIGNIPDPTITLTGNVTGSGSGSIATTIANGAVTYARIQNMPALSVLGRSANSTGVSGAIAAGTDGFVLRRSGTTLGFGTIGNASISDLAYSKLTGAPTIPTDYVNTTSNQTNIDGNKSWLGNHVIGGTLNVNGQLNTGSGLQVAGDIVGLDGIHVVSTSSFGALAGTGTRMVVANATGVLSTQAIPSTTAQTLSLGTSAGEISISGGNSISLNSLSTGSSLGTSFVDWMNDRPNQSGGFFSSTTGATGLPTTTGLGLYTRRLAGTLNGSMVFWTANNGGETIHYTTGSGTTLNPWKIIADRDWVNSQIPIDYVGVGGSGAPSPSSTLDVDGLGNNNSIHYLGAGSTNLPSVAGSAGGNVINMGYSGNSQYNAQIYLQRGVDDGFWYRRHTGTWYQGASREWVQGYGLATAVLPTWTLSGFDNGTYTQFMRASSGANTPFNTVGVGINLSYAANRSAQLWLSSTTSQQYALQFRTQTSGNNWSPVRTVWHDGNFDPSDYATTDYVDEQSVIEALDEGNGIGYRIRGRNPNSYGNIGLEAVDFSYTPFTSGNYGATGMYSFAVGNDVIASGTASAAFGFGSEATAHYSVAFGRSEASGNYALASGQDNVASGIASASFGSNNNVSGAQSVAMGASNVVTHNQSMALGSGLISGNGFQSLFGRFNIQTSDALLVAGNGLSVSSRSNAYVLYNNGNSTQNGNATINGTVAVQQINSSGGVSGTTFQGSSLTLTGNVQADNINANGNVFANNVEMLPTVSQSLSGGSISPGGNLSWTVTVSGASAGDIVQIGIPPAAASPALIFQGYVSGTNTVQVTCYNASSGVIAVSTGSYKIKVVK